MVIDDANPPIRVFAAYFVKFCLDIFFKVYLIILRNQCSKICRIIFFSAKWHFAGIRIYHISNVIVTQLFAIE